MFCNPYINTNYAHSAHTCNIKYTRRKLQEVIKN